MGNNKKEEVIKKDESAKNNKVSISLIIALMAVLISFFSILLGYKENSILEEQQKLLYQQQGASVWPFLENNTTFEIGDSTAIFEYNVTNKGVGPAIIDSVNYTYKNVEITSWGLSLELKKEYPNLSINQTQNADLSEKVLAPGESHNLVRIELAVKGNIEGRFIDILTEIRENYKLTYCYCSVYGDCWQVEGMNNLTKSSDCMIRNGLVN